MRLAALLICILTSLVSRGQTYNREAVCGTAVETVQRNQLLYGPGVYFKAFNCTAPTKLGIRVEIGAGWYQYRRATADWIGKHSGASFALSVAYRRLSFGVRAKLATTTPDKELVFGTDTLPRIAEVNPIRLDYCLGYSFDFKYNISLEPYFGISKCMFYVINEKELKKTYELSRAYGLLSGVSINKYFTIKEFQFLAVFVHLGYSFTDFTTVNSSLGKGSFEWIYGIAYKGFARRKFYREVQ